MSKFHASRRPVIGPVVGVLPTVASHVGRVSYRAQRRLRPPWQRGRQAFGRHRSLIVKAIDCRLLMAARLMQAGAPDRAEY